MIDVIIPVFNQSAHTDAVLRCVANSSLQPANTIVIDNGSTDDTGEILQRHGVSVICNEENVGVNAAWWQGVLQSTSKYLGILNNDIIFQEHLLWLMVELLECDDQIGVVGPAEGLSEAEARAAHHPKYFLVTGANTHLFRNLGSAMFLSRERMLNVVGEFPEGLIVGYGDYYIADRLKLAGFQNLMVENVKIHHKKSTTVRTVSHDYGAERALYQRYMTSGTRTIADLEEWELANAS